MSSTKISISLDDAQLRLARRAAKAEGISLSAFIARGVEKQLEEHVRDAAADALIKTWGDSGAPTATDRDAFRRAMERPVRRRKKAA
jgi:hypothetical protein